MAKPAKSSALVVVAKPKAIDMEKLDSVQIGHNVRFEPKAHGKRVVEMMAHIEGLRIERSRKAIIAGLYLGEIKCVLGHGAFEAWMEEHLGKSVRTGRRYMALAGKFAKSARVNLPELAGANQLSLDLKASTDDGRSVLAKLDKFVGNLGLTELMQRHDVIKQGGARPSPKSEKNTGGANDGEGEPTADEAEDAARTTGLEAVETAENALLNDVLWHDLTAENAALIDAKLKTLSTQFHERLLKLKHSA